MKTFLQQIEEAFEAIDKTNDIVDDIANREKFADGGEDLEEQNVTSAVAGYDIPAAFSKRGASDDTVEVLGYKKVHEAVNTPPSYRPGEYQKPESEEEEYNEKFPFADDEQDWQHSKFKYPTEPLVKTYKKYDDRPSYVKEKMHVQYDWSGVKNKTDKNVYETMDSKYEQLIESYKQFSIGDPKTTPESKIKHTIKEVAKRLQQVEELVSNTARLKTESGMARSNMGSSVDKALTKISERLIKISERVRALGE